MIELMITEWFKTAACGEYRYCNLCTGSELNLVGVVLITRNLFSTLLTNTTI